MVCALLTLFCNQKLTDTLLLKPGKILIGREECDLIIEHTEMSSKHCKIEWIGDCFQVFDLHSTNGTYVNGARIVKSKLQDGDKLSFGALHAQFTLTALGYPLNIYSNRIVKGHLAPFPMESLEFPMSLSTQKREVLRKLREQSLRVGELCQMIVSVEYPNGVVETVELPAQNLELGREAPFFKFSHLEDVSRKHTAIKILPQGFLAVEDLGSTNGTLVNNEPIQGLTVVFSTDRIQIGPVELRVQLKLPRT